jgi:hypothetical protein
MGEEFCFSESIITLDSELCYIETAMAEKDSTSIAMLRLRQNPVCGVR